MNPKYPWEKIQCKLVRRYQAGASTYVLEQEFHIPATTIATYLRGRGLHRTLTEARALAQTQGRLRFHAPKNFRTCEICTGKFKPASGGHKHCKACLPDEYFRRLYRKYRVSKKDWDRILQSQNGTCALCSAKPVHVDHCHKTGTVRGLLCSGCNWAMRFVDRDGWVEKASMYRTNQTGCNVDLAYLAKRDSQKTLLGLRPYT